MTSNDDLLAMYERAMADCASVVARGSETDLRSGTPCVGWDLSGLLGHMIGQNEGFATAVKAGDADTHAYESRPVTSATAFADWSISADRVLSAFRSAPADHRVRVAGFGTFGVQTALRMQMLDTLVHAWDVAEAVGLRYRPSDDLVGFAAGFATRIAKGSPNGQPGVFAAPLGVTGIDAWADALRLLGRNG